MSTRDTLARYPLPAYVSLQASSYDWKSELQILSNELNLRIVVIHSQGKRIKITNRTHFI